MEPFCFFFFLNLTWNLLSETLAKQHPDTRCPSITCHPGSEMCTWVHRQGPCDFGQIFQQPNSTLPDYAYSLTIHSARPGTLARPMWLTEGAPGPLWFRQAICGWGPAHFDKTQPRENQFCCIPLHAYQFRSQKIDHYTRAQQRVLGDSNSLISQCVSESDVTKCPWVRLWWIIKGHDIGFFVFLQAWASD